MTKRDYELIAEAIRTFSVGKRDVQQDGEVREDLALHFSSALASTNPHFDSERFIRACTEVDETPHAAERRRASLKAGKERVRRALGGS